MAPLCSDPRQIVITFNPARRQALLKLVNDIVTHMLTQLETPSEDLGPITTDNSNSTPSQSGQSTPRGRDGGSTPQPRPQATNKPNADGQQDRLTGKAAREAASIQKAAVRHMFDWKKEFMPKLEEIIRVDDDAKIQGERRKRVEEMDRRRLDTLDDGEDLIQLGDVKVDRSEDFFSLQLLYPPIPTRLTSVPQLDRKEALSCILLLILSTGKYSAHSRTLALYLASSLELPQSFVIREETEIANTLMESSQADEKEKEASMSAETEAAKRRQENKFGRFWKVGLASVAGAAIIGVTGGLAAPLVAGALGGVLGGIGLGGVASFLGIFWMNGALVGALFGAYGAKMTGEMMDNYAKEVEDFKFIPLQEEEARDPSRKDRIEKQNRRLRITIGINGWLNKEEDVAKPWRVLSTETEVFALRYELKTLIELGTAFTDLVKSAAWSTFKSEVIKRTVFATLWAALWPIQLLAAASKVDNPYSRGINRSRKAGRLLADALINRVQGERPVTLIGYSLGAAAIHACLQSLAERRAFGLIDTVVIMGAPAPAASSHWRTLRTVVSGKIFSAYSENDMVLGFVYRMYSLSMGVAGLEPIKDVEGVENLDLSDVVSGHLRYPELTGEILRKCGFVGVKASNEIEKDEVIRMKDEYAEGHLIDFDGPSEAKPQPTQEESKKDMADDLRGLTISPPALEPGNKPKDSPNPPLPRRPTQETQASEPPLPQRPSHVDPPPAPNQEEEHSQPEKPKSSITDHPCPYTPTSNMSDDEEFQGIIMANNDSP